MGDELQLSNISTNELEQCLKCTICTAYCPVAAVTPFYPGPKHAGPDGERYRIKDAKYFEFKIISPRIIDELNIYAATKKAMEELKNNSKIQSITLTDAMKLEDDNVIPIIKGDSKSINIAAASILAKVLRDHIMEGYNILYPQYEFNKHKGYPTKRHLELMEEFGLLDIYRFSYGPCKEIKLF